MPLPHKEGLCGTELFSCREEGRDVEVSLFLSAGVWKDMAGRCQWWVGCGLPD